MDTPSPSMRDLARQLLVASRDGSDPGVAQPGLVIEKLRASLSRFAGVEGFASLQRRALTLASAEMPSLQHVRIDPEGRLQGLEHPAAGTANEAGGEAAVVIAAHLLELLVTFIGESITLRLVRDAWPDAGLGEYNSTNERDQ